MLYGRKMGMALDKRAKKKLLKENKRKIKKWKPEYLTEELKKEIEIWENL